MGRFALCCRYDLIYFDIVARLSPANKDNESSKIKHRFVQKWKKIMMNLWRSHHVRGALSIWFDVFVYCYSAIASTKSNKSSKLGTDLCKSDRKLWWILKVYSGFKQPHPSPFSSSQTIINHCHYRASLHIVVIIWKRGEQSFCSNNKCVKNMCIVKDSCTHSCACNRIVHCVIAVNKKTVSFLCNSGRSLIAFGHSIMRSLPPPTTTPTTKL